MSRKVPGASSNGRTADFGSAYEGSNPSAPARFAPRAQAPHAEVRALPPPERFLIVPVGPLPRGLLAGIAGALQAVYGPASDGGPPQARPEYAFNKDRRQFHSTAVLRRLEALRPRGRDVAVLGVVDVDLFVPDQPFVLGESDREAHGALVSIFRLKGGDGPPVDSVRLLHRARVEAVHAVGHLVGLSHCGEPRCAMFLSQDPADSDRKEEGLCPACRSALGRA